MSRLTDLQNSMVGMFGSRDNPLVNPNTVAITAGTNAAPEYPITVTSGTGAMVTLTIPYAGFQGRVTFLPTAVFTWTAAGNIALAGSAVVGKALDFIYNPTTAKWYPSYIA